MLPSQFWWFVIDDTGEFYFLSQCQPATPMPAAVTRKKLLHAFNTHPHHGTAWWSPREASASGRHLRLTSSRQRRGQPKKSLSVIKDFTGKDQYLPHHGPPGRMPASPSITARCGQWAPRAEFHFLSVVSSWRSEFSLCQSDQDLWRGKNPIVSDRSHLWITTVWQAENRQTLQP